nr:hypothetical protein [Pseudomonas syringae]
MSSTSERRYPDHTTKESAVNKIVYVKAYFKPVGEEVTVKVPTGEIKKGFFGDKEIMKKETQWQQTGWSDSQIDGEQLSKDVEDAVARLNDDGYEIQTVLPIVSGAYDYALKYRYEIRHDRSDPNSKDQSYVFGYGYSSALHFFAVSDGLTGLGGELLKRRTMSFLLRGVLIDTFISV